MCRMASFVVTTDAVFWDRDGDSHDGIIKKNNLHVDGARGPNAVSTDIVPPGDDYSLPIEQWVYRVDQDILPEWYDAADVERRCRAVLPEWYEAHVIRESGEIRDGQTRIVFGHATQHGGTAVYQEQSHGEQHGGKAGYCGQSHGDQHGGEAWYYGESHGEQHGGRARYYGQSHGEQHGGVAQYDDQSHGDQHGGEAWYYDQSHGEQHGGVAWYYDQSHVRYHYGEMHVCTCDQCHVTVERVVGSV